MADERDFELLDDYLTNRMSEEDRSAFEQKLQADPDLQHEYALQQRLIKGIQDARVAELKSMLNKVPVPAGGSGSTIASKIMMGTVVTVIIAAAALWYLNKDQEVTRESSTQSEEQIPVDKPLGREADTRQQEKQPVVTQKQTIEEDKNQTSAGTEHSKPSLAKKPTPLAPGPVKSSESEEKEAVSEVVTPEKQNTTRHTSSLTVVTHRENTDYKFHYQFRDGKVLLYGPFEKGQYEIVEFNNDGKNTILMYFKDRYYVLDQGSDKIQPLQPVTDPTLIKKLGER